ncbi:peptidoglycan-binding protein [Streptomyces sp. BV286]|uniref:peptidoglycan-binding protein n=1 Tax=unclassified Streptomyces TaxID=2593676 RepID=UPI001C2EF893|nr:peptidoglycan-binding protein [Streptomyces sp. BV286]MBV1937365.1 peptidoglycan-binding protein [Streptomyces sp. BV286]
MTAPAFEEFDPESDCECPGCAHWRRVLPHSAAGGIGGHPAALPQILGLGRSGRTPVALALAAAAGTVLGAGHTVPAVAAAHAPQRPGLPVADEPDTPQGGTTTLHGPGGVPARIKAPHTSRAEIINRAKEWVAAQVPYSMSAYWSDGYRQDCSGFVSMAWNLGGNEWTGSLDKYAVRIPREELQPGDMLLFHNPADPEKGSHVVIFGGWTDYTQSHYIAYEQARPHARRQATPYAYWSNSDRYLAYRYKGLKAETGKDGAGTVTPVSSPAKEPAAAAYPGATAFGPGANNAYVTRLGRMLVARGAGAYYTSGPGPRWSDADRRATQAFQQAQGWTGADADGSPGPMTWAYLVSGKGRDIRAASGGSPGTPARPPAGEVASHGVPGYPGRALFRPGASNAYVTRLGKQLVKKGFGKHYAKGPGPSWGEGDRRNVEAFQRAQGWRGGAADGYPGPETWRRLFS